MEERVEGVLLEVGKEMAVGGRMVGLVAEGAIAENEKKNEAQLEPEGYV